MIVNFRFLNLLSGEFHLIFLLGIPQITGISCSLSKFNPCNEFEINLILFDLEAAFLYFLFHSRVN